MKRHLTTLLPVALLLIASPVSAHPFHDSGSGYVAGFFHPFAGLDHLLAMIAVGLWAAQFKGRVAAWLPLTFVGVLLAGAAFGMTGHWLPSVEPLIAASVLALGLMITLRVRLPVAGIAFTAAFAACHGIAHGIELPATALALPFAAGFASATILLHLIGFAAGRSFGFSGRWAGMPIAIAGSWLLIGALT